MRTTEEKNRMIAEFMGYEAYEHTNSVAIRLKEGNEFNSLDIGHIHAKFHISWDWLMPVIGEVKYSAGESDEITDVLDRIDSGLLGRNIEYTFNSVVEFIEWYNEQKF